MDNETLRIPKKYILNKNECMPLINKLGYFSKPFKHNLSNTAIDLLCVINKFRPIAEVEYPKLHALNKSQLSNNLEVSILAHYEKLKYIKLYKYNKYSYIIVFRDSFSYVNAMLQSYIHESNIFNSANKSKYIFDHLDYIIGTLFGYPESYIRGYFLFFYITRGLPPHIEKIKIKQKRIQNNSKPIDFKAEHKLIYSLIKEIDNFKDFDEKFEKVKQKGKDEIEKILNSSKFKEYVKKKKIHTYKFDIDKAISPDSDLYDPAIIKNTCKFRKKIDAIYKKK